MDEYNAVAHEQIAPSSCTVDSIVLPPLIVEIGKDGKCTEKGKADIKAFLDTHVWWQNSSIGPQRSTQHQETTQ